MRLSRLGAQLAGGDGATKGLELMDEELGHLKTDQMWYVHLVLTFLPGSDSGEEEVADLDNIRTALLVCRDRGYGNSMTEPCYGCEFVKKVQTL